MKGGKDIRDDPKDLPSLISTKKHWGYPPENEQMSPEKGPISSNFKKKSQALSSPTLPSHAWRIIPVTKWLITMVIVVVP